MQISIAAISLRTEQSKINDYIELVCFYLEK